FGACDSVCFCGWDHAASAVWELRAGERRAFCKAHRQRRKFLQESTALREWGPQLDRVPRLLAVRHERPHALLLTALPGAIACHLTLSAEGACQLHRRAGAWLARLHALPVTDDDPLPLGQALRQRAAAWIDRSADLLDGDTRAWVASQAAALDRLDGTARVPCHRDYSPRNWLIEPAVPDSYDLAVIDFEHAQMDWWLQDCDRLRGEWWVGRPELERAFYAGYGRRPDANEQTLAGVLGAINALSTVVWGHQHGDQLFARAGRERLYALRQQARSS
ncbi:MAG: aminoglycoside phosphotransferase family protein, partial [Planctomycetota bacterium]